MLEEVELRERAADTPLAGHSVLYAICDGQDEVGFLVLDEDGIELVFYSLWISKPRRGKGYGRGAMGLVLERALEEGYQSIVLRPVPLDDDWDEQRLRALYRRTGYSDDRDDPSLMRRYLRDNDL
jgi:GNAT superfamily N-acetyltransferase